MVVLVNPKALVEVSHSHEADEEAYSRCEERWVIALIFLKNRKNKKALEKRTKMGGTHNLNLLEFSIAD